MIMAHQSAPLVNLPLLFWSEYAEIERLQTERALLHRRILLLRPHCHKRLELELRLRDLTARQLAVITKIGGHDE